MEGPSSLPLGISYGIEENVGLLAQGKRPAIRGEYSFTPPIRLIIYRPSQAFLKAFPSRT